MADSGHSREPLSLHSVPEVEEDDPFSSPRQQKSPSGGSLLSSSIFRRDGYQAMASEPIFDLSSFDDLPSRASPLHGSSTNMDMDDLGISAQGGNRNSIARVPVGSKMSSPATPRSHHGFLDTPVSGTSSPRHPQTTVGKTLSSPNLLSPTFSPISPAKSRSPEEKGRSLPPPWDAPPTAGRSWFDPPGVETGDISRASPGIDDATSKTVALDHDGRDTLQEQNQGISPEQEFQLDDDESFHKRYTRPPSYCDSKRDVHMRRFSWLSMSILTLSIYSTALSCMWFIVALVQPRWGRAISSSGGILPSTASLVCALFAKTIEMSFVTVFVSFIGQVLTRRAFVRKSKGMTLSEMTMRNWVIQPGSLITHWETLPYAGLTFLGVVSLIATIAATFYTTASDAMISPKLKYGGWEHRELQGRVRASYSNPYFVRATCPTPLEDSDPAEGGGSCLDVQYSGQSFRNLMAFLGTWQDINDNGTSTINEITKRPVGTTLLYDNTTLTSSWIEGQNGNTTRNMEIHNRIINNVTLAMPHPGVYDAATDPINGILQPNDLSGVGEYAIKASVVSPTVNVMCVNMARDELAPLIYTEWPNNKTNDTVIPGQKIGFPGWQGEVPAPSETEWLNRTVVDDIFRWGEKYKRRPPVFQLYPNSFNMITNTSVFESSAVYLLAKSPSIANYTLCELRSWVSPNCSTQFNISGTTGAHMRANCEDPEDMDSYVRSFPDVTWSIPSTDWKNLADQWRLSMDLNGGVNNNNASNARILTQLILQNPSLPTLIPSMAEALAVLISSTLVIGALKTPYRHYWDYPKTMLGEPGAYQPFNASIQTQQYTSSHINDWQKIFYVILLLVFAINVFCLVYFIARSGMVTDFTEPQNMFALAVNSPPSTQLKGSCGGGPRQRDLVVPWRVAYAPTANHYFFDEASERPWRGKYARATGQEGQYGEEDSRGRQSSYRRLSRSRGWL